MPLYCRSAKSRFVSEEGGKRKTGVECEEKITLTGNLKTQQQNIRFDIFVKVSFEARRLRTVDVVQVLQDVVRPALGVATHFRVAVIG